MAHSSRVLDFEDGSRQCSHCGVRKPLETAFDRDSGATKGRRAKCKSCRGEQMAVWYQQNQERQRDRARARFVRDIDKIRENDKLRYYRNREKRIALATESVHRRRAAMNGVEKDVGITREKLRERDGDLCCYCRVEMSFAPIRNHRYNPQRATIEHIVALSRGGGHTWSNVALSCWQCNVRKNDRNVDEWQAARQNRGANIHPRAT